MKKPTSWAIGIREATTRTSFVSLVRWKVWVATGTKEKERTDLFLVPLIPTVWRVSLVNGEARRLQTWSLVHETQS